MYFFEESCYSLSEMFGDDYFFFFFLSDMCASRLMHEDILRLGKPENNVRNLFLGLWKN